jgi:hypothetical protein
MKAVNLANEESLDLKDYNQIEFNTKSGQVRCFVDKEGFLHVRATEPLIIVGSASNSFCVRPTKPGEEI